MEENLDMPLAKVLPMIQERIMTRTRYFGIQTLKNPLDFWLYQEMLYELNPDVIIEIGNFCGGSALALAHLCDQLNHGRIYALDIDQKNIAEKVKNHPRINMIEGDACQSYHQIQDQIMQTESVMVIEDSSHTYENTINVLETYSQLLKLGDYFIVEDGICYHGLDLGPKPGPYEAIEDFIKNRPDFEIDRSRESFFITWNPKGFLKRVA